MNALNISVMIPLLAAGYLLAIYVLLALAEAAEAPRSGIAERRDECVRAASRNEKRVDDSTKQVEFRAQRGTASGWMKKRANFWV
jgi:hypothetical protein